MVARLVTSSGAIEIHGPDLGADAFSAPFFEAAEAGTLALRWCLRCHGWSPPLADVCPHCHGADLRWRTATGEGRLVTWAVVHSAPHAAFVPDLPIVSSMIELAEGPWFNLRLIGSTSDVCEGAPVDIGFVRSDDSVTYPVAVLRATEREGS